MSGPEVVPTPELSASPEFKDFGKITRYRTLTALVTEKLDGTNAQIFVPEDRSAPLLAGSRTRWIYPEKAKDNFGFAGWVAENSEMLRRLGPGRHYGEWYGASIQRRYGLDEKRFALFNVRRWRENPLPEGLPAQLGIVPVLYEGPFDTAAIGRAIADLYANGSKAVPGWATPEGAIVEVAGGRWKVTDHGDKSKGREEHILVTMDGFGCSREEAERIIDEKRS